MILADIELGATLDESLARVGQANNDELRRNVVAAMHAERKVAR